MPGKEGCITDVNGILVYTSSSSEYRSLFQPDKDDLKSFVRRLLHQAHDDRFDQVSDSRPVNLFSTNFAISKGVFLA